MLRIARNLEFVRWLHQQSHTMCLLVEPCYIRWIFWMDYWTETTAYCPSWQSGNGRMSKLLVRFISGARPLGSSSAVLESVAGFSGLLTWPDDLLKGNRSSDNTSVYEDMEEVVSFAAVVSSSLDVPLSSSCHALELEVDSTGLAAVLQSSHLR
ncbi:hypothetical protein AXG93_4321s1000 [Marchantia polymorpha subsp. ruderalis]|uniref:Uncharacterized protein n=1 Tax=Marchantia polymorpha subsp. ruderalis TaxID=1480154 RepID=A0A176VP86_MARPO|nr:hypothetical protein AXG93_4321s1000 [Marchantia polymorpha subsp. ruderalis]